MKLNIVFKSLPVTAEATLHTLAANAETLAQAVKDNGVDDQGYAQKINDLAALLDKAAGNEVADSNQPTDKAAEAAKVEADRVAKEKADKDAKDAAEREAAEKAAKEKAAKDCPTCKGTGKVDGKDCEKCDGKGTIEAVKAKTEKAAADAKAAADKIEKDKLAKAARVEWPHNLAPDKK